MRIKPKKEMSARIKFILAERKKGTTIIKLATDFGVSRQAIWETLKRYGGDPLDKKPLT